MPTELRVTWLKDRVLGFLQEGDESDATAWLRACPLLAGTARRGFGDDIEVEVEFGCSRANMRAFRGQDEAIAEAIYDAFAAVTSPHRVRYSIVLRYLTPDELAHEHDDVILKIPERSAEEPPPF